MFNCETLIKTPKVIYVARLETRLYFRPSVKHFPSKRKKKIKVIDTTMNHFLTLREFTVKRPIVTFVQTIGKVTQLLRTFFIIVKHSRRRISIFKFLMKNFHAIDYILDTEAWFMFAVLWLLGNRKSNQWKLNCSTKQKFLHAKHFSSFAEHSTEVKIKTEACFQVILFKPHRMCEPQIMIRVNGQWRCCRSKEVLIKIFLRTPLKSSKD